MLPHWTKLFPADFLPYASTHTHIQYRSLCANNLPKTGTTTAYHCHWVQAAGLSFVLHALRGGGARFVYMEKRPINQGNLVACTKRTGTVHLWGCNARLTRPNPLTDNNRSAPRQDIRRTFDRVLQCTHTQWHSLNVAPDITLHQGAWWKSISRHPSKAERIDTPAGTIEKKVLPSIQRFSETVKDLVKGPHYDRMNSNAHNWRRVV